MKRFNIKITIRVVIITIISLVQFSCNEEFPNLLKDEYKNKEMGSSLNKVLIIVADGVRGEALTEIDPENLRKVARNSLFSNTSLGDYNGSVQFHKETGLANIFTGVTSSKHGVTNDLSLINSSYETIFKKMKESYPVFEVKAFTSNSQFKEYILNDVEDAQVVSNDNDVISNTKEALKEDGIQMVVTHLSNVEKIGIENSFETSDPAYREAILNFDDQVLSLISSLEERPNYKTENWLVIITSSVGGDISGGAGGDETVYGDSRRNTFTYFYSPRFSRKYVAKPSTSSIPFTGSGLHLTYGASGNNATSARLEDVSKINFPGNQDFTITFFFKQAGTADHNYPAILMKRESESTGNGFQFLMSGGTLEFGANGIGKIKSASVKDAKWHAITLSVNRTANTAKIYTDGVLSAQTTAGTGNISNSYPLILGKSWGSNTGDFIVCNLQIYNVAMTDDQVKEYARLGLVKEDNSPFYSNLMGYWPAYNDVGTGFVTDVTGKAGNMKIHNEVKWASFDEYVPYFRPDVNETTFKLVPNQVDIPLFVYQWYGVLPRIEWQLDGQAWTPPYAVLEY